MYRNELAPTISLEGTWDFSLGSESSWATIQVPGCWEAQGFPKLIDGPARYQRWVVVPQEWVGQQVFIEFEAVSYACIVTVNGNEVGRHRGIWTPFALDITGAIAFGQENLFELEIFKPGEKYPLRTTLAGFLPDVALMWGGLWQPARLRALSAALEDLWVDSNPDTGEVSVRCRAVYLRPPDGFRPDADSSQANGLNVIISHEGQVVASQFYPLSGNECANLSLTVPHHRLWSPENPALYHVQVQLLREEQVLAQTSERIGFRRLSTSGYQLMFNGQPICLRGVLSWGWDPDLIAPAFPEEQIRNEFRRVKSLGFNLVKLCLLIPNPLYYQVADEEGMLLWQEWPLWIPDTPVTDELRARAPTEYAEYMTLARHHPSIVVYSLGCELKNLDVPFMSQLNSVVRAMASNVLFCDNSGSSEVWSAGLHVDFADFSDFHIYSDLQDFEPILDFWRRDWMRPRPWLSGEFCDSDTFRDLHEIIAANKGLKPWWITKEVPLWVNRTEVKALTEELELIEAAKPGVLPAELTRISYGQSWAIRKTILEALRRRETTGGYVVTGIRDTPIFTSGIFDDFNRPKWTPQEFTPFNNDTVLTYDVDRRSRWPIRGEHTDRVDRANWWVGEPVRLYMILNNAGKPLLPGCELAWRVLGPDQQVIAAGRQALPANLLLGRPQELATLLFKFPLVDRAVEYRLESWIEGAGREIHNYWPLWSYPRPTVWPENLFLDDPSGTLDAFEELLKVGKRVSGLQNDRSGSPSVVVSTALSSWVVEYLRLGGRVLLLQQGTAPLSSRRGPFWREAIKIFYPHPLWERFAHQGYTDLQFLGLSSEVMFEPGCIENKLPDTVQVCSLMKRMDAREFYIHEYLLEARVGQGKLLACALRLQGGDGTQPESLARNIAGQYLLFEMLRYLQEG